MPYSPGGSNRRWTDGRTDGWTDGWMDGWMDGPETKIENEVEILCSEPIQQSKSMKTNA
jgi:hypothetical protein